jgi:enoyl-CoA hydratase/carnithine racemase
MAAAPPSGVRSTLDSHVGLVELCRPPHNLLDADLLGSLVGALDELASTPDCRVIVLAAEGRSFCAGGNFAGAGTTDATESPAAAFRGIAARFYGQAERIFAVTRPMIAAVHGPAIGAGLGLALACDVRVTCKEAFFAANFVRLGIHPGFSVSTLLPATIGRGAAADMLLTGRRINGEEAFRIGLADRLARQAQLRNASMILADGIATAAPLAVASTRATLRQDLLPAVRASLAHELEEQVKLVSTADAAEGITAMLQGRGPEFTGR